MTSLLAAALGSFHGQTSMEKQIITQQESLPSVASGLLSRRAALEGIGPAQLQRLREYWVNQLHQNTTPESFSLERATEAVEWLQAIAAAGSTSPVIGSATSVAPPISSIQTPSMAASFRRFADDYLAYAQNTFAVKTVQNAQRVIKCWLEIIGDRPLGDLTLEDLEQYRARRLESGISRVTTNIDFRTLRAMLGVAVAWRRIPVNPFANAKELKLDEKRKRVLSQEECALVLAAIGERWLRDIVGFAVLTGLRLGEIANLRWSDYSRERSEVVVESSRTYRVKGGRMRTVPLPEDAQAILEGKSRVSEWIFVGERGRKFTANYISRRFKRVVRTLGLPEEIHFHGLRASCLTFLAELNVPPHLIKAFAGHSSLETTEGYIAASSKAMREQVGKLRLPKIPPVEHKSEP